MYVSIDIETLGLDPSYCDVIEFGAVIDNLKDPIDKLPTFHCYVLPPRRYVSGADKNAAFYQGQPYALMMHADKLKRIALREKGYDYDYPESVGPAFADWLVEHGYKGDGPKKMTVCSSDLSSYEPIQIVVGGKNFFGFDAKFLSRLDNWDECIRYHHRYLDPATPYFNPAMDAVPPGLDLCLERAGIKKNVEHNAVADALDVIKVLRVKWGLQ